MLSNTNSGRRGERATFGSVHPLYYFDFDDGRQASCDTLGTEFANLEAVADEAVAALAEIARDRLPSGTACWRQA